MNTAHVFAISFSQLKGQHSEYSRAYLPVVSEIIIARELVAEMDVSVLIGIFA